MRFPSSPAGLALVALALAAVVASELAARGSRLTAQGPGLISCQGVAPLDPPVCTLISGVPGIALCITPGGDETSGSVAAICDGTGRPVCPSGSRPQCVPQSGGPGGSTPVLSGFCCDMRPGSQRQCTDSGGGQTCPAGFFYYYTTARQCAAACAANVIGEQAPPGGCADGYVCTATLTGDSCVHTGLPRCENGMESTGDCGTTHCPGSCVRCSLGPGGPGPGGPGPGPGGPGTSGQQCFCGDGIIIRPEECDPPGDGCSSDCKKEEFTECAEGYHCVNIPPLPPAGWDPCGAPFSGMTTVWGNQECGSPSGTRIGRAGQCVLCAGEEEEDPPPGCGNGTLEDDEECEDGNTVSNDGCSAACRIEPDILCREQPISEQSLSDAVDGAGQQTQAASSSSGGGWWFFNLFD